MSPRAIFLSTVIASVTASATPTYTGIIMTDLGSSPPGLCGVCHMGGIGMAGNVTTPFGRAMRMAGLMPNNDATLRAALTSLRDANTDSDGDGCTDIAELSTMPPTSPNRADCAPMPNDGGMAGGGAGGGGAGGGGAGGGGQVELPPLSYGCGSEVAPGALAMLAVLLLSVLRR
jgi:hypothetical protein